MRIAQRETKMLISESCGVSFHKFFVSLSLAKILFEFYVQT